MAGPQSRHVATTRTTTSTPTQKPKLLTYVILFLLVLVFLAGLAVLIAWLAISPKRLVYSIENASIENFNLTNDNHLVNTSFDFFIRSDNPNKRVTVYYDKIEVNVVYNDQNLANTIIPPFRQPHKNVTHMDVKLNASSVALPGDVVKDLKLEKASGDISFDVWIRARIRFKVGAWKSRHRHMRVACYPKVKFTRPKSFGRTKCSVEV